MLHQPAAADKANACFSKVVEGLKLEINAHSYLIFGTVAFDGLQALDNGNKLVHSFTKVHRSSPINAGILGAGQYLLTGRVEENGELDITIKDRAGIVLASFICDELTSMGTGTFSGEVTSPPKIGLGSASSNSKYTDGLVSSILNASQGGQHTSDYFDQVNAMGQLFQQLAEKGEHAWSDATDADTDLPMKYIAYTDQNSKQYYITVQPQEMQRDAAGNIIINGAKQTINGVDYEGIGMVTMTCGWEDFAFSETSWWLGVGSLISIPIKLLWTYIGETVKAGAIALGKSIMAFFNGGEAAGGGVVAEEVIEALDASAKSSIRASVSEVAIEETGLEVGAVASGTVFFAVALFIAILFLVLSLVFHNTYHSLRVWNLTKYTLNWNLHFDNSQAMDQGVLVTGPVVFKKDKKNIIDRFVPFLPVIYGPPVPGVKPTRSCHYGDLHVNSSHEFSGIGYVLQFHLVDNHGNEHYKATAYFDLPFSGSNSTGVSLNPNITNLQAFYNQRAGDNKSAHASATSDDGQITISTTYDYLTGKHVVPGTNTGGNPEQYFYQSVLTIHQKDTTPSVNATADK